MQKTSGHMSEFIDAQKPGLFDYIMRMTGNPGRAESALFESVRVAQHMDVSSEDLDAIRVGLYKMARKFTADVWYGEFKFMLERLYEDHTEGDNLIDLEFALDELPSNQKEFLLLHFRYGFSVEQIADLTSKPFATVSSGLKIGQKNLFDAINMQEVGQIKELIEVPFIKYETQTEDIAELFDSIKQPFKVPKGLLALCIFLLLGYALWHYEMIDVFWRGVSKALAF